MNSFEILDHPADIGIKVKGKSLEELFTNAAFGTTFLIVEPDTVRTTTKKEIDISGNNTEELFTNWLDEIIYLFDSEGFLIQKLESCLISGSSLNAALAGERFAKDKHKVKLYLKAVTYHQLEIKQTKEGWQAKVFFDV